MSDEADTSNDGDMGNDMHDFHGMKNFNFFHFSFIHHADRLVVYFQMVQMVQMN